jgi:uncharacterized protein
MLTDSSSTGLSDLQLSRITAVLESYPGIRQAVLFGSRAMGTHRYGSDIDIALDADNITFDDLLHLNTVLDALNLPFTIDIIHLQRTDNTDLIDHIHRVGKILISRKDE